MAHANRKQGSPLPQAKDNARASRKKTLPEVTLMHLRSALKNGALRGSDPVNIVKVAANLLAGVAAVQRKAANEDELHKFVASYGLPVGRSLVSSLFEQEKHAGWLTSQGIGEHLTLTAAEQERLKCWTIGVRGETAEDQQDRKLRRQALKAHDKRAKRDAARGPFWINVAGEARKHGLSAPTIRKLHKQWQEAVIASIGGGERPDFVASFSTFVSSSKRTPTYFIEAAGRAYDMPALMKMFGKSERSIQRWIALNKLEANFIELRGGRGLKARPSTISSSQASQPRKANPIVPVHKDQIMEVAKDTELERVLAQPEVQRKIADDRRKNERDLMRRAIIEAPAIAVARRLDPTDGAVLADVAQTWIDDYRAGQDIARSEAAEIFALLERQSLSPDELSRRFKAMFLDSSGTC